MLLMNITKCIGGGVYFCYKQWQNLLIDEKQVTKKMRSVPPSQIRIFLVTTNLIPKFDPMQ